MTFNKHIRRNFNANKTHIKRYDDDKFHFEIFKFDKTYDMTYTLLDSSNSNSNFSHNGNKIYFDGMSGVKKGLPVMRQGISKREDNWLIIEFDYTAKTASDNYRIEFLYTNTYKIGKDDTKYSEAYGSVYVNDEKITDNIKWVSNDMSYNRHYEYVSMGEGVNHIKITLSPNLVFYGAIVKKFDIWEGHRPLLDTDDLVTISAETSHTKDFQVDTMNCSFMYSHDLDELLPPTDSQANRSGLVFDFRDEINLYITRTDGVEEQVFGGYISTAQVDDKLTVLTLECANRLIDMERRYCLSEIGLKGYSFDEKIKYDWANDTLMEFDYYSQAIKFLMNHTEVPIQTNVSITKPLVQRKYRKLAKYGKKGVSKLTTSNIDATPYTNYIMLRNGVNRNKQQSVVLYENKNYLTKKIPLDTYPNLAITYGLGKEEWEETIVETTTVIKHSGVSDSVMKWADKQAKNQTGMVAVKSLWRWIVNNVKHNSKRGGFYQKPSKTLSSKVANCCCKAELLLDGCNYKGITDLQYVHVKPKGGGTGHVFCKINGKIVDPSTSNGWGSYYKKQGTLSNASYSTYPTKPF